MLNFAPHIHAPPKIVVLGMMSKMPVAGIVWLTMQYVVGLKRLGYDVYYVEAHARTPSMFMQHEDDDSSALASAFIAETMRKFDMGDKWAFQALHNDGRCYGLSSVQLSRLYQSAALIINMHGGTAPLPEHYQTNRLIYLGTDPVQIEIELYNNIPSTVAYLEPHCAFFTWGENYGNPDCQVPYSEKFHFKPTRQPVLLDMWDSPTTPLSNRNDVFTTIGNWRQPWRKLKFQGETYYWSKHLEFQKFLDLPQQTDQPLELALANYDAHDEQILTQKGWRVRPALDFSTDVDAYHTFITQSRGEFTVAKDQNIRLRSGWFSDRSATYLAAGRPVITQETGFSNILPTGEGLFPFTTMADVLEAIDCINHDYARHCQAARAIAHDYFRSDYVLSNLLQEVGV